MFGLEAVSQMFKTRSECLSGTLMHSCQCSTEPLFQPNRIHNALNSLHSINIVHYWKMWYVWNKTTNPTTIQFIWKYKIIFGSTQFQIACLFLIMAKNNRPTLYYSMQTAHASTQRKIVVSEKWHRKNMQNQYSKMWNQCVKIQFCVSISLPFQASCYIEFLTRHHPSS